MLLLESLGVKNRQHAFFMLVFLVQSYSHSSHTVKTVVFSYTLVAVFYYTYTPLGVCKHTKRVCCTIRSVLAHQQGVVIKNSQSKYTLRC